MLYEAFFASAKPVGEDRIQKHAAAALLARGLHDLRDSADYLMKLAGMRKVEIRGGGKE